MIRENNHNEGIVGLSSHERQFRRKYKKSHGSTKNATKAYSQHIIAARKYPWV